MVEQGGEEDEGDEEEEEEEDLIPPAMAEEEEEGDMVEVWRRHGQLHPVIQYTRTLISRTRVVFTPIRG